MCWVQGIAVSMFVLATLHRVQTVATAVTTLVGHLSVCVRLGSLERTVSWSTGALIISRASTTLHVCWTPRPVTMSVTVCRAVWVLTAAWSTRAGRPTSVRTAGRVWVCRTVATRAHVCPVIRVSAVPSWSMLACQSHVGMMALVSLLTVDLRAAAEKHLLASPVKRRCRAGHRLVNMAVPVTRLMPLLMFVTAPQVNCITLMCLLTVL